MRTLREGDYILTPIGTGFVAKSFNVDGSTWYHIQLDSFDDRPRYIAAKTSRDIFSLES